MAWQSRFNPEKCKVMRATHSRDGSKPSYSRSLGVQLKSVESVKDLGVKINYSLSCGKNVSHTVKKASKVLGVIKRSLGNDIIGMCFLASLSLVRPIPLPKKRILNPWKKSKEEHHG